MTRRFGEQTFRALEVRNFRLFFIGQALSQNGTWMQLVAIDLLVLHLTDDGTAVGIATAARLAPVMVLGAWGGLMSDRMDRQRLLIGLNVAGGVVAIVFWAVVASGTDNIMAIYSLAAVSGVVTALENPARRAIVTDLVSDADITNAVGLNSAMLVSSKVTGPALAGVVITATSLSWCFAVNGLSFVPQIVLFLRMDRRRLRPSEKVGRGRGQIRAALRYVWSEPDLRVPILLVMATGAMNFNYPVIFPLLATRDLGGGDGTYSLLLSVMSIGSVIGALVIARRTAMTTRYIALSAIALAGTSVGLAVAPTTGTAAIAAVPVGVAIMLVNSGSNSIVQLRAAPAMRGRVLALMAVVFVGSAPLGAPLVGWIAEHAGARAALMLGAMIALVAGSAALRSGGRHGPRRDRRRGLRP